MKSTARLPRYAMLVQSQHIIQCGNNHHLVFAVEADYLFFRDALVVAAQKHGLFIHAYVWMTNHIHLLVTLQQQSSISRGLQAGRKYVLHFNYSYTRSGTLWGGG